MAECLNLCRLSDHRWTFHSERVQSANFENSPVNHLTELQSVSPQQLIQPYRYSSEPLPLHLDPPLAPLSVSPQVSSCVEMSHDATIKKTKSLFMWSEKLVCTHIDSELLSLITQTIILQKETWSVLSVILLLACSSNVLHWQKTIFSTWLMTTVIHTFAQCFPWVKRH